MANQKLINSILEISKRNRTNNVNKISTEIATQTWSSVGIALYNTLDGSHEEKVQQIITFLNEVQEIWSKSLNNTYEVCEEFYRLTGLTLNVPVEEEE